MGAARLHAAPTPKLKLYKNTDFVDAMISNILHNLLFSQN
jgi:hypothetical protein